MNSAIKANRQAIEQDRVALKRVEALMSDISTSPRDFRQPGDDFHAAKQVAKLLQQRIERTTIENLEQDEREAS